MGSTARAEAGKCTCRISIQSDFHENGRSSKKLSWNYSAARTLPKAGIGSPQSAKSATMLRGPKKTTVDCFYFSSVSRTLSEAYADVKKVVKNVIEGGAFLFWTWQIGIGSSDERLFWTVLNSRQFLSYEIVNPCWLAGHKNPERKK